MSPVSDRLIHWLNGVFAGRHEVGCGVKGAVDTCKWAANKGWAATISVRTRANESKLSAAMPCLRILRAVSNEKLDVCLSLSPAAIRFDLNMFEQIASAALLSNIRIYFDPEPREPAGATLAFLNEAVDVYPYTGYTLRSERPRSLKDALRVAAMEIPVRVVKERSHTSTRQKYLERGHFLYTIQTLSGQCPRISIATDDYSLAHRAIDYVRQTPSICEFEELGIPTLAGRHLAKVFAIPLRVSFECENLNRFQILSGRIEK